MWTHKLLCNLDQRFREFVRGDQCVTIIFSFLWHIVYTHTCAPTHTRARASALRLPVRSG